MNILHISTYDIQGGAARAAYRLHLGLRELGQDSQMLVHARVSTDPSVLSITINPSNDEPGEVFFYETIQSHYINNNRTDCSDTIFSLPYPGYDITHLPVVQAADIINLHWVVYYQSPITLQRLFNLGKPVVWTLHDQWPFTGGCHYTAGCKKYYSDCRACPQLADDPFNLPAAVLKDKLDCFIEANLTIVTPSQWLAECAGESKLFKDHRIEVIPYALETDIFYPLPKTEAKARLGLTADTVTLLFGAVDTQETRKGFYLLLAAMQHCTNNAQFQQLITAERLKILCFGYTGDELKTSDLPVHSLGYLNSDEQIALAYASADLFILPSLEDNLPNTMLEAMSCGTPVVGFAVGGLPDLIKNSHTGQLVPPDEAQQLGEAILALILAPQQLTEMGQNCRHLIETGYTLPVQAQRYLDLYQELLTASSKPVIDPIPVPINEPEPDTTSVESLASVETVLGPNFQMIFEPVLLIALQKYAPLIRQKWQEAETDRAARLDQINELTQMLEQSEADRAARLTVIQNQEKIIQSQEQIIQSQELRLKRLPVRLLRRLNLI